MLVPGGLGICLEIGVDVYKGSKRRAKRQFRDRGKESCRSRLGIDGIGSDRTVYLSLRCRFPLSTEL